MQNHIELWAIFAIVPFTFMAGNPFNTGNHL